MTQSADAPSPELFLQSVTAYQRTEALRAAIELDLFTAIAEGSSAVAPLAERCSASQKGVRVLCDYLAVAGFLVKADGRYALTPSTAKFLDRRSPAYMGGTLDFLLSEHVRGGYTNLPAAVRKGGTVQSPGGLTDPEHPAWIAFARAMMPMMAPVAHLAAQLIDRPLDAKLEVLDIAAGHGLYGIEVGKRFPQARVTRSGLAPGIGGRARERQAGGPWPALSSRSRRCLPGRSGQRLRRGADPEFSAPLRFRCVRELPAQGQSGVEAGRYRRHGRVRAERGPGVAALPRQFRTVHAGAHCRGRRLHRRALGQLDDMLKQAGFASNTLQALEPTAQHAVVSRK